MEQTIKKIGKEVDEDIFKWMMADNHNEPELKNWELLADPVLTMLRWQELRDRHAKTI